MLNENNNFEGNHFALKIMGVCSFVDDRYGDGNLYQIEATTVRLNHVAYDDWLLWGKEPDRENFLSAAEWENAKLYRNKKFEEWMNNVFAALHINHYGNMRTSISHADVEVFIVVCTRKITAEEASEY